MRALQSAVLSALLGLAPVAPAGSPAAAGPRALTFQVDWGPVGLAEVRFVLVRAGGEIRLRGEAEADGAGAAFSAFRAVTEARYGADGARDFLQDIAYGGREESRRLRWSPDGVPAALALPPPRPDEGPLTPVPETETAGTVDPFFPVLDVMARLDSGGDCTATYRVWDGTRRYDLGFTDLGPEEVAADRRWTWGGPARKCGLAFRRIGGFPVEGRWREEEGTIRRHLWFAPLDGLGHVPVRFAVAWSLGTAIARIDFR